MIVQSYHRFLIIFTTINYNFTVPINHQLSFIIEVNLNQFCIQTKNDSLFCFEPLFNVNKWGLSLSRNWTCWLIFCHRSSIKIFFEILHEGNLFRNLSVCTSLWSIYRSENLFIVSLIGYIIDFSKINKNFTVLRNQYTF